MSDPNSDERMIEAFTICARALDALDPERQQRVIRALQALFPDSPKAPAEPHKMSSAELSVLRGLMPIGPTKYGQ